MHHFGRCISGGQLDWSGMPAQLGWRMASPEVTTQGGISGRTASTRSSSPTSTVAVNGPSAPFLRAKFCAGFLPLLIKVLFPKPPKKNSRRKVLYQNLIWADVSHAPEFSPWNWLSIIISLEPLFWFAEFDNRFLLLGTVLHRSLSEVVNLSPVHLLLYPTSPHQWT